MKKHIIRFQNGGSQTIATEETGTVSIPDSISNEEQIVGNIALLDALKRGDDLSVNQLKEIYRYLLESRKKFDSFINSSHRPTPSQDIYTEEVKKWRDKRATDYENNAEQMNKLNESVSEAAEKEVMRKHKLKESQHDQVYQKYQKEYTDIFNKLYPAYFREAQRIHREAELTQEEMQSIDDNFSKRRQYIRDIDENEDADEDAIAEDFALEMLKYSNPELAKLSSEKLKEYIKTEQSKWAVNPLELSKRLMYSTGDVSSKANYFTNRTGSNVDKDNKKKFTDLASHVNGLFVAGQCWGDVQRQNNILGQKVFNLGRLHNDIFDTKKHYGLYYSKQMNPKAADYELNSLKRPDAWDAYNLIRNFPYNKAFVKIYTNTPLNGVISDGGNKEHDFANLNLPIGTILNSGDADKKGYIPNQPDGQYYPAHATLLGGYFYDTTNHRFIPLTQDYGGVRTFDEPMNNYTTWSAAIPEDVQDFTPENLYKFNVFANYYTPTIFRNLANQMKEKGLTPESMFQKPMPKATHSFKQKPLELPKLL